MAMDFPTDWDEMTGDQRNEWLEAKNCVLYRGVVLMAREELDAMREEQAASLTAEPAADA